MKLPKIILIILILALVITLGWSVWKLRNCIKQNKILLNDSKKIEYISKEIENAVIASQLASIKHLGQSLIMKNIQKIYPKEDTIFKTKTNPKFIIVFSEMDCDVCREEETQFGVNIAKKFGSNYVRAIIHAENERYIHSYIRLNQINFPVFYCKDKTFFKVNKINNSPIVFVVDDINRIIAAHFPIPGHFEYSKSIHRFCIDFFRNSK